MFYPIHTVDRIEPPSPRSLPLSRPLIKCIQYKSPNVVNEIKKRHVSARRIARGKARASKFVEIMNRTKCFINSLQTVYANWIAITIANIIFNFCIFPYKYCEYFSRDTSVTNDCVMTRLWTIFVNTRNWRNEISIGYLIRSVNISKKYDILDLYTTCSISLVDQ